MDFGNFVHGYRTGILNNTFTGEGTFRTSLSLAGYSTGDFTAEAHVASYDICERYIRTGGSPNMKSGVECVLAELDRADHMYLGVLFYNALHGVGSDAFFNSSVLKDRYEFSRSRIEYQLVRPLAGLTAPKYYVRDTIEKIDVLGTSTALNRDRSMAYSFGAMYGGLKAPSDLDVLAAGVDMSSGKDKTVVTVGKVRMPAKQTYYWDLETKHIPYNVGNDSLIKDALIGQHLSDQEKAMMKPSTDYESLELRILALQNMGGCTCFKSAPCSFCMELTEEETNAYANGTMAGLRAYWAKLDFRKPGLLEGKAGTKEIRPGETPVYERKPTFRPASYEDAKRPTDTDRNGKKIRLSTLSSKSLADAERDRFNLTADIMFEALNKFPVPTMYAVEGGRLEVARNYAMAERIAYLEGWQVCWTKNLSQNEDAHDARIVEKTGNAIASMPKAVSGRIDPIHRRLVCAALAYKAFVELGGVAAQIDRMIKDITRA